MFDVPILFIVFNRLDTTKKVFEQIKKIEPKKLFISSDGPRKNKNDNCEEVRNYLLNNIDWECQVFTKFNKENLGCKYAVSSAIDWFFENVEEGIILEDDCFPDLSFFYFCQTLLEYYRYDTRIMHIGGTNFQNGNIRGNYSYYFSFFSHIWGWATWRRAWKYYDVEMKDFKNFKENNIINNIFETKKERKKWLNLFETVYKGMIDTWDYQWFYTVLSQNGLCLIPNYNLVSNIGFGVEATHTKDQNHYLSNMKLKSIDKKIIHPLFMYRNKEADYFTFRNVFNLNLKKRIINKIISIIR